MLLSMIVASAAGVGLALLQIRLTMRLAVRPNLWMAAAKLPMWVFPMLAAAYFSVPALLALTAGASCTYLGWGAVKWRKLRKGGGE